MAEKKKSTSSARPRRTTPSAEVSTPAVDAAPAVPTIAQAVEALPVEEPSSKAKRPSRKRAPEPILVATDTPAMEVDAPARLPSHDAIARRAFEIFRERGGSAFENWLQAERELRG